MNICCVWNHVQDESLTPAQSVRAAGRSRRQQVTKTRQERDVAQRRLEKDEQMRQADVEKERDSQRLEQEQLHRFTTGLFTSTQN